MFYANDYDNKRIFIDDTQSSMEYFCPYCGAPVIMRKGDQRRHHFAHKRNYLCKDTWERSGSYNITPWHDDWQSLFPAENQEVKLTLGDTVHRADVLVGRTVIEFQHSSMNQKNFDDRNNFYLNLGYKVIWLFDMSDLVDEGKMEFEETDGGLMFQWTNPKKAFNSYDVQFGNIELFFQLGENDPCIVKVLERSEAGFEVFWSTELMTKDDFLDYVRDTDGSFPAPLREDILFDEEYSAFKEKYGISLNRQQERAMISLEGSVLLLAVPGSGKTTVLVDRIGYMVLNRGIPPEDLLVITFTIDAAAEMRDRFCEQFGEDIGKRVDFRTINSLSLKIYKMLCQRMGETVRSQVSSSDQRRIIRNALKKRKTEDGDYTTEADVTSYRTLVGYIKNMQLNEDGIRLYEDEQPWMWEIYREYLAELKHSGKMDFDDQMVYARYALYNDDDLRREMQGRYKYILVDEAQDTSKIQHEIIQILAEGNNLFMVGDEDQSIYGFRGAYPRAFLNFKATYKNPYILRMETNYRSTSQITDLAQKFISRNLGRFEKHMVSDRGPGEDVRLIKVSSLSEQYEFVLNEIRDNGSGCAVIYRQNDSAAILVDVLLDEGIPFSLKKPDQNFWEQNSVKAFVGFLKLSIDGSDVSVLDDINYRGILYLPQKQAGFVRSNCRNKKISVCDALEGQMKYLKARQKNNISRFIEVMESISGRTVSDAMDILEAYGFEIDGYRSEMLRILAKRTPDIRQFVEKAERDLICFQNGHTAPSDDAPVLTTVHSAKGREYDSVYMIDVFDDLFPSSKPDPTTRSKDNANAEMEERRVFYVGMTRAKNRLCFFSIKNLPSQYIEELFPETVDQRMDSDAQLAVYCYENPLDMFHKSLGQFLHQNTEQSDSVTFDSDCMSSSIPSDTVEAPNTETEEEETAEIKSGYEEIIDQMNQQDYMVRDSYGVRWIKCTICGKVMPSDMFSSYGGAGKVNLGECRECTRNSSG